MEKARSRGVDDEDGRCMSWRMSLLVGIISIAITMFSYGLLSSPQGTSIDSVPFVASTPPRPFVGALSQNEDLQFAYPLFYEEISRPESILYVSSRRTLFTGLANGTILEMWLPRTRSLGEQLRYVESRPVVHTSGRPAGLAWSSQEEILYVADIDRGLVAVDVARGQDRVVVSEFQGRKLQFPNGVDIDNEGIVYFTDATRHRPVKNEDGYRDDLISSIYDGLEGKPWGRLFMYNPVEKTLSLLADDIRFANGVSLDHNFESVLVSESQAFRILRIWIRGPKAGTQEVFLDGLPGYPDNIMKSHLGRRSFWVAIPLLRSSVGDWIGSFPRIKNVVATLPQHILHWIADQSSYGLVLEVSEHGEILRSFHDTRADMVAYASSAVDAEGHLFIGSIGRDYIATIALERIE